MRPYSDPASSHDGANGPTLANSAARAPVARLTVADLTEEPELTTPLSTQLAELVGQTELRGGVWSAVRGPTPWHERRFVGSTFLLVGCQVTAACCSRCCRLLLALPPAVGAAAAICTTLAQRASRHALCFLYLCLRQAPARLNALVERHGGTLLQAVGNGANFVVCGRDTLSFDDACTLRQAQRSNLFVVGRSKVVGEAEALKMLGAGVDDASGAGRRAQMRDGRPSCV